VSAWGSVGRTTCETAPVRHRVPLPAGQRRAQLNHLTRRCDFPRLAQDADPDGRIGALLGRMVRTAGGARGRAPGDETSGPGRIWSDHHRLPNRPRYRSALPRRIARYPRRHPGHRLGRRRDGLLRVRGRDAKGKRIVVEQSGPIRIVSVEEVTVPDCDNAELWERTIGCRRMQRHAHSSRTSRSAEAHYLPGVVEGSSVFATPFHRSGDGSPGAPDGGRRGSGSPVHRRARHQQGAWRYTGARVLRLRPTSQPVRGRSGRFRTHGRFTPPS
jgi:hypothetical protein